jgi:hypothetical protein
MRQDRYMPEPPNLSPLVGCTVGRLCLDYQVTLLLASTDGVYGERVDALLVVESPFTIRGAGEPVQVVPSEKKGLEATLGLLHREVTQVAVGADESLSLTLDDSVQVQVPRDPDYEAWNITGRGVQGWIAGPL